MPFTQNVQMGWLRRHASASAIALLLLVLLFAQNLNLALASSGGVMGGSFFDSDSSSSESYTSSDSETQTTSHYHTPPPPPDAEVAGGNHGGGPMLFFIFIFGMFLVGFCMDKNGNSVTVLKLQFAMSGGKGSTIQRDLTRIAETADTSSREGVSRLLTETIHTLDRNTGHCIAGYLSVDIKRTKEEGEKCYYQLSNEERAKFDEETIVNLNSVQKRSTRSQSDDVFGNEYTRLDVKENMKERQKFEEEKLLSRFDDEYIVITILVSARGAHRLPNINGAEDMKKALQNLRSLLSSKLLVLWTPQNEDDTLSKRKLLEDYPQLANCMSSFLAKKQE